MSERYRVIQWATGAVGMGCLREVLRRPNLELVGVLVYSADKAGVDAAELAGSADETAGVVATQDRSAIIGTEADCVIYTPLAADLNQTDDDIVELLSAGKNVITTAGYFAPECRGQEVVSRLHDACRAGGTSLLGTGINPGFMFDRVGPVLTGVSNDVDYVRLVEIADASQHPSVEMLTEALGIGHTPEEVHVGTPYGQYWATFFSEVVTAVANGMGVQLDRIETGLDVALASRELDLSIGRRVPAGAVVGNCHTATGIADGKRLIRVEIYWSAEPGVGGWPVPAGLYSWEVHIEGRPSLRTRLDVLPSLDGAAIGGYDPGVSGTAATCVNAISQVVAADPGILRTSMIR